MQRPSGRIFQEVLKRILKRADFPSITRHGKVGGYIRFHDLRHTFASHWNMNDGDIFKLQKILGHADISMTIRYSHLNPQVYKEDYSRFGGEITFNDATILKISST